MTLNRIIAGILVVAAAGLLWWGFSREEKLGVVSTVSTSDTVQTLRLAVNDLIKLATNFSTTTNNTWTGTQIFSQTSTTTWAGGIQIDGGGFQVSTLTTASCDLKADTSGNFYCGSDSEGTAAWPFTTSASYNGQITQSTSTLLWLRGSALSLAASSSVLTYASSTALTATNLFGGTLVLTNDLAVAQGGTGLSTFGGTNTILFTSSADTLTSDTDLTWVAAENRLVLLNASTTNLTVSTTFFIDGRNVNGFDHVAFTYATSSWTGTTTVLSTTAPYSGTLHYATCAPIPAGTLKAQAYINNTPVTPTLSLSSTATTTTAFTGSNTFTAGDRIKLWYGTPASSPTGADCTLDLYD